MKVYIDGACKNNNTKNKSIVSGGIGIYFGENDSRNVSEKFVLEPITNNRCEIYAAIKALEILKDEPQNIIIYTDSNYLLKSITEWINNWKRNGWKTANKKPVQNQDLFMRLDSLIHDKIKFQHINSHLSETDALKQGISKEDWYGNKMADNLATSICK